MSPDLAACYGLGMLVSVVIPTLNEAGRIVGLVAAMRASAACREVIVVDGGSHDGTADLARAAGAQVFAEAPGRGRQLSHGAARASGDVLLFLHADSALPGAALDAIVAALADPAVVGGNFRIRFDGDSGFARWLTGFYAWFRRFDLFYGDSAIFLRREIYDRLGGIRPIALMEDYDLCLRMGRAGRLCCIDEPAVVTSSRRFAGRHPVAIVSQWLLLHALYYLKVPPDLLARLYRSGRG